MAGAPASFEIASGPERTTVVTIHGELDMSSTGRLGTEVQRALDDQPRRLVVDVSDVRFADSSAIALWVRWAGAVTDFELRDPPALLQRVIATMGLSDKLGVAE